MKELRKYRHKIDEVYSQLDNMRLCESIHLFYNNLDGKSGKPYSVIKDNVLKRLENENITPENFDIGRDGLTVLEYVKRELDTY